MKLIKACFELVRFIDYIHDRKKYVPLKFSNMQPQKYLIDAYFYKMKADYLKYIYECLDGDNGLLANCDKKHNFYEELKHIEE